MVVAIGEMEAKQIIQDFIELAKGNNDLHEKNPQPGMYRHGDGWGLAYLDSKGAWHSYRSTRPIYDDETLYDYQDIKAKALIIHARRATQGERLMCNTQPLHYKEQEEEFVFAHNGDIQEHFHVEQYAKGSSDTVRWFNKILDEIKQQGKPSYYDFEDYSAANFFFATKNKIVVGQNYKTLPKYHTMKVFKDGENCIISSEVLPTLRNKKWHHLQNRCMIEIPLDL